jgi:hypothetical protein
VPLPPTLNTAVRHKHRHSYPFHKNYAIDITLLPYHSIGVTNFPAAADPSVSDSAPSRWTIGFQRVTRLFAARKAIRGGHCGFAHAGVPRIVPGPAHNDEFAAGPMLTEPPWRDERPSEVQAAVNQDAGNARKAARFSQENTIFEPGVVAPIVGDDAGKRQPEGGFLVPRMRRVVRMHRYESHLPVAPVSCGLLVYGWIGVHEEAMIGFNEVASNFRFGHAVTKTCPLLWEENANSTGYPVELPGCVSGDADKHHFSHSMGMPFGVSERQGRSTRPAKHQPPLDIEAPPQQFDICEEMSCRVRGEIYVWLARVRRASSRSALVEQNDPIDVWIKGRREPGEQPEPGPPWSTTAGLPDGFPHVSQ